MFKLLRDLLSFVMAVVEILLTMRFILKILGANAESQFVNWVYVNTQPLLQPFQFAFPTPSIKGGFVLEFTTLFALFAYAFMGYILQQLLNVIDGHENAHSH